MTNTLFLKQAIAQSMYTEKQLAKQLGISTATFVRKLNNLQEFRASEMETISRLLDFSEEENINVFFGNLD